MEELRALLNDNDTNNNDTNNDNTTTIITTNTTTPSNATRSISISSHDLSIMEKQGDNELKHRSSTSTSTTSMYTNTHSFHSDSQNETNVREENKYNDDHEDEDENDLSDDDTDLFDDDDDFSYDDDHEDDHEDIALLNSKDYNDEEEEEVPPTIQAIEMFLLPETISVHEKGFRRRCVQSFHKCVKGPIQQTSQRLKSSMKRRRRRPQHSSNSNINSNVNINSKSKTLKEISIADQAKKREMTMTQEIWNAITMIPPPAYMLYFILAGKWLSQHQIDLARASIMEEMAQGGEEGAGGEWELSYQITSITSFLQSLFTNNNDNNDYDNNFSMANTCLTSSYFPNLHAIPPLPLLALALGVILHSPCSMLYHLLCAFTLDSGPKRMDHWSRRLDQAMIHFIGICWTYGTNGYKHGHYFIIACIMNVDSIFRLFQDQVRPRRILYRMILAFALPIAPFLLHRDTILVFIKLVLIYTTSAWLFSKYPFGGWSHGFFHLLISVSNPITCWTVTAMMESEGFLEDAARCAVLKGGGVDLTGDLI